MRCKLGKTRRRLLLLRARTALGRLEQIGSQGANGAPSNDIIEDSGDNNNIAARRHIDIRDDREVSQPIWRDEVVLALLRAHF